MAHLTNKNSSKINYSTFGVEILSRARTAIKCETFSKKIKSLISRLLQQGGNVSDWFK